MAAERSAAPPREGHRVASFASTSDVCLTTTAEKEEVVRRLQEHANDASTLVLVGYSDATEISNTPKDTTSTCSMAEIQGEVQGHLRVAAYRAIQVYEIGRAAGIPGFQRPPLIVLSFEEISRVSLGGDVVFIIPQRSPGKKREDRRVELYAWPKSSSWKVAVVRPPPGEAPVIEAPPPVVESPPRRAVAWSLLATGLASTAVATGFFAASAQRRHDARSSFGQEALSLQQDGLGYARIGGTALGIGIAAVAAGIVTLAVRGKGRAGADVTDHARGRARSFPTAQAKATARGAR